MLSESEVDAAINKNMYYDYVESKHVIENKGGKNDVDTIHTLPHVNTKTCTECKVPIGL